MQDSSPAVTLSIGQLREVIREEVEKAVGGNGHREDRLLDAEEAAKVLCVSPDWLYRHAKRLPFSCKLGPKMLRFSYQGIQKYLEEQKHRFKGY